MKVDTASLRQFIVQKFNPDELKMFLFDYFPSIYNEITTGMNQSQRVQLLFDHCLRQELFPYLLTNLKRERLDFDPKQFTKAITDPVPPQLPEGKKNDEQKSFGRNPSLADYEPYTEVKSIASLDSEQNKRDDQKPPSLADYVSPSEINNNDEQLNPQETKNEKQNSHWPEISLGDYVSFVETQNDVQKSEEIEISSFIHPKTGKEMVHVPAGEFLFGDRKITKYLYEFWIDKTPVTNAEYKRFLDANPHHNAPSVNGFWGVLLEYSKDNKWNKRTRMYPSGTADHPVVLVSGYDADVYTKWAQAKLPTEMQWEKAGRGTDGRKYPWGDEWFDDYCYFHTNETKIIPPVGYFSPKGDSPYGCADMLGHVWEWTLSSWQGVSNQRVVRGVAFKNRTLQSLSITKRFYYRLDNRAAKLGFRVVVHRPPS